MTFVFLKVVSRPDFRSSTCILCRRVVAYLEAQSKKAPGACLRGLVAQLTRSTVMPTIDPGKKK